jgi:crotonobetainyl-CoA:carnitine CoA-transferase CaiB-like acyl-CoA transferase
MEMDGPLNGIRVLEVANWIAAPAAATLLSDLGAEVIKVEPPEGDITRGLRTDAGRLSAPPPPSAGFQLNNRGKRSICINLREPEGRAVVHMLAGKADVFIANLTPQRLAQFELDYETLSGDNPRLIYAAVSAYGARGPEKDRLGYDYTAFWARSGIMSLVGDRDAPPVVTRPGFGDHTTALALAYGVLVAIFDRERTGKGQEVQTSLLNTAMWVLSSDIQAALNGGSPAPKHARVQPRNPLQNPYQTSDGHWLQINMPAADRYWPRFCEATCLESLRDDPRFATLGSRQEHSAELVPLIDAAFASKTRADWAEILDRYDLVWAPVQSVDEVVVDPQVRANDWIATVEHPSLGPVETIATPVQFGCSNVEIRGPAPETGEHTEEILLEMGYSWEAIGSLRESGAVGPA